jgi:hypothetical protein
VRGNIGSGSSDYLRRRLEDIGPVCTDDADIAYENTLGAPGYPFPEGAVVVTERGNEMIKFTVKQVWDMENDLTLLAVHHHTSREEPEAECDKTFDVAPGDTMEYTAICIDGKSEVSLFVYVGDGVEFEPSTCAACEPASGGNDSDFVQYYMELNCMPKACAMDCPTDIELYFQQGGSDDDRPIEILEQGNNTVTFRVLQPWSGYEDLDHLYIQYHNETDGGTDCVDFHKVSPDSMHVFTAYCMVTTPKTIVDIWVSNPLLSSGGSTDINIPECCHPPSAVDPNAKIQYSFLLNCVSTCSPDNPDPSTDEPDPSTDEPDQSTDESDDEEQCELTGIDFQNMFGSLSRSGYVDADAFEGQGITVTASSDTGFTPSGKPRILDTNPVNPAMLPDKSFGSPNESCNVSGPGVGSGGMVGESGENCDALGPVMIIQESNALYPISNPSGGIIHIDFEDPETVMELVLFNVGLDGATVTIDTKKHESFSINVSSSGINAVQKISIDKKNVKRISIHFKGVGALAKMTLCRHLYATPAPIGNTADIETDEPTAAPVVPSYTPAPIGNTADIETYEPTVAPVPVAPTPSVPTPSLPDGCVMFDANDLASGYVDTTVWSSNNIASITASSDTGYTPDGKLRVLHTHPSDLAELVDHGFGSPNQACMIPGPGVGIGGGPMAQGENCHPLNQVLVIQKADSMYAESNPGGGKIEIVFDDPVLLKQLVFFNLGTGGAFVTIESISTTITLHVAYLGENAVEILKCERDHVRKVTIILPGIGSIVGLTTCEASPVHGDCIMVGGGELSGSGYLETDAWAMNGLLMVTATSDTGYTPGGKVRLLDTNPSNLSQLVDSGFGSPNMSCDVSGPGVGSGGMKMSPGENCVPLGSVMIIQKSDTPLSQSNPGGGTIILEFTAPVTLADLTLFNVGIDGAMITIETTNTDITMHIPFFGLNGIEKIECMKEHVTKVTIIFIGIGAVAGFTFCEEIGQMY